MEQQLHPIALLVPEIKELLQEKNYTLLKQVLRECNPIEFTDFWKKFDEEERLQIFKLLPAAAALRLFEILDIEDQRFLLAKLNEDSVTPLLENMHSPDLAKLFHKMSPRMVKKMSGLIKRQEALAHVDLLMKYPENTAGSLMHLEFIKLTPKLTAKQALLLIQAITRPKQKEHLSALYVTDDDGKLLGAVDLHDLIIAPEDEKLSDMMTSVEGIKVKPETDQEEVAKLFSKYRLTSAPVIDENGKLIGILMLDDIISVVRQEATEDIAKMAGTRAVDIKERSVFRIMQFRMPWLVVTLFAGIVISFIIRHYEPILNKVIALVSFTPIIAGMGGNVGSQSATIVVRSIALGQINGHQKMKTIFREMRVGLFMGLIYGVILGVIGYLIYGAQYHAEFSLVVAVGMCTSMTVAATMGAIGPILFDRVGIDPATATGPIITTLTDVLTVLTYLSFATLLLGGA